MSTPNFAYENRCVLVTNDDFEYGNVPDFSPRRRIDNRYYPTNEVGESEYVNKDTKFQRPHYHAIVVTSGYYSDACLDFVFLDGDMIGIGNDVKYTLDYDSVEDFIDDVVDVRDISRYRVRKLLGKRSDRPDEEIWEFLQRGCDAIDEYLMEREKDMCNEIVDYLKSKYGYDELVCTARFSNGEAWYEKIG